MRDWVVGDVKDAEFGCSVEAGDLGQRVVGDVEFFEVGEGREAGDGGEAVRLYGEKFQGCQSGEVLVESAYSIRERKGGLLLESPHLYFCDLILPQPKLLHRGQRLQVLNILLRHISTSPASPQTCA
jgi:hypothetical protein